MVFPGVTGVLGVLRGAPRPVHGGPQGAEAVRVRRRDVEQRHVGADQAPAEEQRQVPQVDGTWNGEIQCLCVYILIDR